MAQIDAALASDDKTRIQSDTLRIQQDQLRADQKRQRQELRLAPWQLAIGGTATGVALFAAAFALAKLFQWATPPNSPSASRKPASASCRTTPC
jgi:hypothetical protein